MFKIVATFFIPNVDLGEEAAREIGAELVKRLCRTGAEGDEDELIAATQDADAVITNIQPYTRRVIERLSKCRAISAIGIGYDWIDVQAATDHGICVVNVPDYCLEEVSAHTMALLLACSRKLVRVFDAVRAGKWNSAVPVEIRQGIQPPMFRLKRQTLGLVGFGNIARTLVPMAKGFGLRVIAYDPHVTASVGQQYGVELVGFDRLLEQSDFVSLHANLTTETRHMIGLKEFKRMKPTAYFINTARGALVDEGALYTALSEGYIAGAGLDVLDPEPPNPDNLLLKLNNVIITAHMAQYSDRAEQEVWRRPAEAAIQVLKREWPRGLVNPQVKAKFVARWGEMK